MKSSTSSLLSIIGAGLLQFASVAQATNSSSLAFGTPIATTLNGSFYGSHSARYNANFFLGLPYAQPTTGLKNATQYGSQCVGYGSGARTTPIPISEDCLTLNVVRPAGFDDVALPVAVRIHGRNFQQGSSVDPVYNLTWIVQGSVESGNPIIGVSINYRLHTWGFLFSQELKDEKVGNLGLRDQRAAFEWFQDNIASFGGDPSKVTIWGESTDASSVGQHLVAYNGTDSGLFRAAILESGTSVSWPEHGNITKYQTQYDAVTNATGCGNATDTLQCLRELPFETLNSVLNSSVTSNDVQYPMIDDDFLLQSASTQLKNDQFVKVPILLGTNFDEGASFAPENVNTTEEFRNYLIDDGITSVDAALNALLFLYPNIPSIGIPTTLHGRNPALGLQYKRCASMIGDILMHAPRRLTTEIWAAHNLSSYNYHFNVVPNGPLYNFGSDHGAEWAYVFNIVNGYGYAVHGQVNPFADKPDSFKELARLMTRQWSSFVANLDLNGSGVPSRVWSVSSNDVPYNYVYDVNVTASAYLEPDTFRAEAIDYTQGELRHVVWSLILGKWSSVEIFLHIAYFVQKAMERLESIEKS